jgi:hypothetical protein
MRCFPFAACAQAAALILSLLPAAHAGVITFEDLSLAPNSAFYGPTANATPMTGFFGSEDLVGTFTTGGASFINRYDPMFDSWSGFAYSNQGDNTTAGFLNQFSSFTGGDRTTGSGIFGVAYDFMGALTNPDVATLNLLPYINVPAGLYLTGAYLANTTYAALSMEFGDSFAQPFGGTSGDVPDYFRIRAYGVKEGVVLAERPEFYLADYRFADNSQDYIRDDWSLFDLTSLKGAERIYFSVESSNIFTPTYFAIDDIGTAALPEPSSLVLMLTAAVAVPATKRWRRRRARPQETDGLESPASVS